MKMNEAEMRDPQIVLLGSLTKSMQIS